MSIAANLAVGFTFSTIARNQLQAMQLTFFFFLPSMLLTGFMFPFRSTPNWAQTQPMPQPGKKPRVDLAQNGHGHGPNSDEPIDKAESGIEP